MDAACTVEQNEIRRAVREVLSKRRAAEGLRAAVRTPAGYDAALWEALAGRLGLPGLALPEEYGGVGCGPVELALAGEELGRALAPSPLFATAVLAAPLLLRLGTARQRAAFLPRVASGGLTAALAVPGAELGAALGLTGGNGGDWAGGGRAGGVQATAATGTWHLYGQADQVLDGHSAGLLLVAAHAGGFARSRTLLFLVRGDAPGLVRTRRTTLDETRAQARVELRDVRAELLGDGEGADVLPALADVGERAAAVLAAEAVGAADEALARTLGHVREREQFGRPIGSFQAVKHRLADVYVRVCAARSAAYYAAWAAGAVGPAGPLGGEAAADGQAAVDGEAVASAPVAAGVEPGAGLALACALDALRTAAAEAVQLHGGTGFTWEHDAHLFFKRASGDELLFGPAHRLRAHAAERAGLFAPHSHPGRAPVRVGRGATAEEAAV
ncbi:Acyl-CoA dehydrogenase [Streptomyces sp. YIM 121038]|uniref:acyl-CoA dehydrogenase family protein n=1 Tax=Streptomyces sp. YIM 121038 TaxID=2136401 RepID=UPI001110B3AC|nr:acyl-CoA dehydrogenase family protein [Streptomyces sp. YIM 121038]QCX77308.1 Acyl-CoA dehydrogenase [Streptomyces sp. YIM 121038]